MAYCKLSCWPQALEALAQVFSSEFCEISKKNFFTEHSWTAASKRQPYSRLLTVVKYTISCKNQST